MLLHHNLWNVIPLIYYSHIFEIEFSSSVMYFATHGVSLRCGRPPHWFGHPPNMWHGTWHRMWEPKPFSWWAPWIIAQYGADGYKVVPRQWSGCLASQLLNDQALAGYCADGGKICAAFQCISIQNGTKMDRFWFWLWYFCWSGLQFLVMPGGDALKPFGIPALDYPRGVLLPVHVFIFHHRITMTIVYTKIIYLRKKIYKKKRKKKLNSNQWDWHLSSLIR